ncbi:MAG: Mrp/NBP35 family ATP-binding protein [Verrucomicrobium sp.]|jgi:ATP-binding protein involved in chromosome partitioning|nr:Mrp/NBP35 family ATP-binding protein [Verrucomicrobium sp.]
MATLQESAVLEVLRSVKYPGYSRDIVSFGLVKGVQIDGSAVGVLLELTAPNPEIGRQIADAAKAALRDRLEGITDAHVQVQVPTPVAAASANTGVPQRNRMPGVRRVVAVASGKGGVGKSTCSVNLACALAREGFRVGLLDCDIYGPSIPLMMGVHDRPGLTDDERLVPPTSHGVKLMSMGFLIDPEQAVIWRGPMIQKTIHQFIHQVAWGDLDYLLVDLPPGTGDAQLSLCQSVPLDGGVVITTPQEASLGVVRKGVMLFEKVQVPILGIVENMSGFRLPDGSRVDIFGHGGGRQEAERKGVPFLGEIPLVVAIREGGDCGRPVVVADPDGEAARAFAGVAAALRQRLPSDG